MIFGTYKLYLKQQEQILFQWKRKARGLRTPQNKK